MTRSSCPAWALVALLLLWPARALCHQSSVVYSEIAVRGRQVEYTFQVANTDLYEALGLGRDRPVSRDEARRGAERLAGYLSTHVSVQNHGLPCPPEIGGLAFSDRTDGFFAVQRVDYRCPRSVEDAAVTYNLFFDLDPRHQGLAHIDAFGSQTEHVFRESNRTLRLTHALGPWDNARDYLLLGVEHIFTGYDHLAFLFCLLMIAGRFSLPEAEGGARPGNKRGLRAGAGYVVRVVTAFTLAHSVTLILSALNVVTLPSKLVEATIAATIGYVAMENVLVPQPHHRFALTFCFGLVHGFGFSSVLKEIGLPKRGLILSLLSFNLGVEIGQLVVVAMVFPVLHILAVRSLSAPRTASGAGALRDLLVGTFRPHELLAVAAMSALSLLVFSSFGLPFVQLCTVVLVLPALLLGLVPRLGYDRSVRIAGSLVIFALSVLWFVERVLSKSFLQGALG